MDYSTRKAALDQKAAAILEEYRELVSEIEQSGKHFTGFRKLKETRFALEKIARINGAKMTRKQLKAASPADLFEHQGGQQRTTRKASTPPTDLFVLKQKAVAIEYTTNVAPPNLFANPTPPPPSVPVPPKREKAKADSKRKVLATSEEADD